MRGMNEEKKTTMHPERLAMTAMGLVLASALVYGSYSFIVEYREKRETDIAKRVAAIERSLDRLEGRIGGNVPAPSSPEEEFSAELARREAVKNGSEETALTAAVAKIAPSVVSIVITKDVPQLEVVYENPFGNDPFFESFNIQVPRYRVKGTEEKKVGAGTGFFVTSDGYIVTNRHVVEDAAARYTVLLSDGKQAEATVVHRDPSVDVAVLKIQGSGYRAVEFGDSDALKLGETIFAVGNALGEYNNSVSVGIVSGLNRDITAQGASGVAEELKGVIQTDAAINPGNSGGPLVTLDGRVVGINVAMVRGSSNISFAIPVASVRSIIDHAIGR